MRYLLTPLLAALSALTAHGAVATLTSPDGTWRLQSDEFGAYGGGIPGGGAFHDFGSGIIDYSWASSVMLTDGATRQALSSTPGGGGSGWDGTGLGGANLLSDTIGASSRTSSYSVTGFPSLTVGLTQTAGNSGISQTFVLSNSSGAPLSLNFLSFHDVDLDGTTALNNIINASASALSVLEGSRMITFLPEAAGYQGFLAGHVPAGGLTTSLDSFVWNNFGIPGANLNQFLDVSGGVAGGNFDINADGLSDGFSDTGYVFQNQITVPANGSITMTLNTVVVPEPSAMVLGLAALGLVVRRRR